MRVSLFATCLGDRFFARGAADAVRLLRSLGVEVEVPPGQTCCGQPAWNAGHLEPARRMALHTAEVFRGAAPVVLPSGSCTAMLRCVYPRLLEGEELDARELAEFLVEVLGATELGRGLEGRRLAYHHGCHALRELGQREAPLALLRAGGAELVEWEAAEECCGFGGLFAVKVATVSVAMADRKLDTLPPVDALVSADPGCLLHLSSRAARRGGGPPVLPLASALWRARSGWSDPGTAEVSAGPAAGVVPDRAEKVSPDRRDGAPGFERR